MSADRLQWGIGTLCPLRVLGAEHEPEFNRPYESRGEIMTVSKDPIAASTLTIL